MNKWREWVGSWLVAFRLSHRQIRRRVWQSTMLMVVLALPASVGGLLWSADAATYATSERIDRFRLGQADLSIVATGAESREFLPQGSQALPWYSGETMVSFPAGRLTTAGYEAIDLRNRLTDGLFLIRAGRVPEGTTEAAVSSVLAEQLDVGIGDHIDVGVPQRSLAIVGIIDASVQLSRSALVVDSDNHLSSDPSVRQLVQLPASATGWEPPSDVAFTPKATTNSAERAARIAAFSLVVGFASVQAVLLVGAAFAVSARRRHREMAIVSAVGGTRRQIARIVLAHGILLGTAAAVLGTGLSVIGFYVGRDFLSRLSDHPLANGGHPSVSAHLLGGALSIMLAGLAALGPARGVASETVLAGLTTREPDGRRAARRMLALGLSLLGIGSAAVWYSVDPEVADLTVAVLGAGMVLTGLAACGPALVAGLGRLAAVMVLPLRLSIRHAARHRLRTGAAVAAVCAATAGSIGMILFLSADTATPGPGRQATAPEGQLSVPAEAEEWLHAVDHAALSTALPEYDRVRITVAPDSSLLNTPGGYDPGEVPPDLPAAVGVGGTELIELVTGSPASVEALAALERGHAVVFYSVFSSAGMITIGDEVDGKPRRIEVPALLVPVPQPYRGLPGAVIGERAADELGLSTALEKVVFDLARPATDAELAQAQHLMLSAQLRAGIDTAPITLIVARPADTATTANPMVYLLAVASALMTILAGGVAVGLANSETRADMSTLAAIGGGPWIRRLISASQAGLVVGLGTLLGVIAGFAPAAGLFAVRPDLSWNTPWWLLGGIVLGVPLLAMLGTLVFARSKLVFGHRIS